MHTESRGQLWRASSLPPPSHQCEQLDLGHRVPFPAEPSHQHRLCILIWGISCRCLISSALISSNEHFPSYPNAFISSRHYVHSLVPARPQFPLLFSVAGEICHLMSLMGLGKFSLFLLMRKKDSLLLPLVRLKSLLSARRFMRPQSPRDNMRKSWSTWGECVCGADLWGVCAWSQKDTPDSRGKCLNAYCRAWGRLSSDDYVVTLHSSHAQSSRRRRFCSVGQSPC